jgi:hypothetical protein
LQSLIHRLGTQNPNKDQDQQDKVFYFHSNYNILDSEERFKTHIIKTQVSQLLLTHYCFKSEKKNISELLDVLTNWKKCNGLCFSKMMKNTSPVLLNASETKFAHFSLKIKNLHSMEEEKKTHKLTLVLHSNFIKN